MSPDNTTDGWLKKRWTVMDGKRCLLKGGEYIKVSNLPEDDASVEAEIQKRLEKRG